MSGDRLQYISYRLRLWQVRDKDKWIWRASPESSIGESRLICLINELRILSRDWKQVVEELRKRFRFVVKSHRVRCWQFVGGYLENTLLVLTIERLRHFCASVQENLGPYLVTGPAISLTCYVSGR